MNKAGEGRATSQLKLSVEQRIRPVILLRGLSMKVRSQGLYETSCINSNRHL